MLFTLVYPNSRINVHIRCSFLSTPLFIYFTHNRDISCIPFSPYPKTSPSKSRIQIPPFPHQRLQLTHFHRFRIKIINTCRLGLFHISIRIRGGECYDTSWRQWDRTDTLLKFIESSNHSCRLIAVADGHGDICGLRYGLVYS